LHYYLAAKHNIHPTYIQEILTDSHFSLEDRVGSLNHLKKLKNRTEYKKSILRSLLVKPTPNLRNEFNSFADLKSISVKRSEAALLIGGGSSVETHRAAILQLLKRNQLCTFAVNQQAEAFSPHVDFKIVLPNAKQFSRKFEAELSSFSVVAPFDSFDHDEISKLGQSRLINFPMTLQNETFQFSSNGCTIPSPLSLGYGIAVISALKFKKVFLVGVDGYSHGDSRQKEMCDLFMLISKNLPDLELIALTDTTYPVRQSSIYAPVV
jgi:4-hydroxy 2-oxovalerate aldolase